MNCQAEGKTWACDRPGKHTVELPRGPRLVCSAHYMQLRRTRDLKPLRKGTLEAHVTFRCAPELKAAAERAAKAAGMDPTEFYRQAVQWAVDDGPHRLK